MMWLYLILVLICTFAIVTGTVTLYHLIKVRKAPPYPSQERPPVSILKPLKGVDDALEANLESLFQQTYPDFELLFGVEGESDPAVALVRQLMDRYPQVKSRLVVHDGGRGFNPKVSNIRAILETGSHDILVINDSNIAVPPDYLEQMVAHLLQPSVGLVTSLFVGTGEKNVGALLENMNLNGPVLNLMAMFGSLMGEVLVIGKSNMFRRSVLEELGGFESLAYVQAEDYYMGKMMRRAGLRVDFCTQLVHNVNQKISMPGLWGRYLRWTIARSHLVPLLYPTELLVTPLFIALLAPLFGISLWWSLPWMLGLVAARDASQWLLVREARTLPLVLLLGPVREAFFLLLWVLAPFCHVVNWRGHRLQVGEGTHIFRKGLSSHNNSHLQSQNTTTTGHGHVAGHGRATTRPYARVLQG